MTKKSSIYFPELDTDREFEYLTYLRFCSMVDPNIRWFHKSVSRLRMTSFLLLPLTLFLIFKMDINIQGESEWLILFWKSAMVIFAASLIDISFNQLLNLQLIRYGFLPRISKRMELINSIKYLVRLELKFIPYYMVIYFFITNFELWWIPATIFALFVQRIENYFVPIVLDPLQNKIIHFRESSLKDRLEPILQQVNLSSSNLYKATYSMNNRFLNAYLLMFGKYSRVVFSDYLINHFRDDEIEQILYHELGHYTMKHSWAKLLDNIISNMFIFYVAYVVITVPTPNSIILLMALRMSLLNILSPISKYFARNRELSADKYAIIQSKNPEAFVSAITRLGIVSLSNPRPSKMERFFASHPPIRERVVKALEHYNNST
ncbi:MAG: M48 family metalloprotease [Candidatus Heimdallarchaeota archaeon]|nr:M48 family metalloprotease [Candidatus Heimdallarchaeota archaeon]